MLSTLSPDEVKDEMLARWLRWSEARLNEGEVSTLDASVRAFYLRISTARLPTENPRALTSAPSAPEEVDHRRCSALTGHSQTSVATWL